MCNTILRAMFLWCLLCGITAVSADDRGLLLTFPPQVRPDQLDYGDRDRTRPLVFHLRDDLSGHAVPDVDFTADAGTDFAVWSGPDVRGLNQSRSLGIRITSRIDAPLKDKIIFSPVPHHSDQALDVRDSQHEGHLSFDFMLDSDYQAPTAWLIHMQAFQCCDGHPPLAIEVAPAKHKEDEIFFIFRVRDDDIEQNSPGSAREIYRLAVPRGKWMRMDLRLRPGMKGDFPGLVSMKMNGITHFTFFGSWGYRPDGTKRTSRIGLDLGIYRRRQTTTQAIYFDNISFYESHLK